MESFDLTHIVVIVALAAGVVLGAIIHGRSLKKGVSPLLRRHGHKSRRHRA